MYPKGYISPIWGETPSNLNVTNVTKFCMWVPFPTESIVPDFIFTAPIVFGGQTPENWLFPLTWRVTFTTARALTSSAVIATNNSEMLVTTKLFTSTPAINSICSFSFCCTLLFYHNSRLDRVPHPRLETLEQAPIQLSMSKPQVSHHGHCTGVQCVSDMH